MSYVSAFTDDDEIVVIERVDGERIIKRDNIEFVFYTLDQYGDYTTIFGDKCTKHVYDNRKEFYAAMRQYPSDVIYEHDVNPVFRYLSKNYDFDAVPNINTAFYDIEVAFHEDTRYSNPEDAENEVISVAVYQNWSNIMYMIALPPPTMTMQECEQICSKIEQEEADYEVKCVMVNSEAELLKCFLLLIEDSDVISGWNSESYDFKYLYNRITKVIGQHYLRELCVGGKKPSSKSLMNPKTKQFEEVFSPIGRVHLDYMNLYKKYTYIELPTYKLDHVAYIELDERKVEYPGTLDQLYKQDFEKFVRYNIKDTYLVKRIDDEKKFIDLTNLLAHNNGVLLETTLGTVGITEQAIINQGHYFSNEELIFPSKPKKDENESGAAGAFVSPPKVGIRKLVAGNDINSLYPSTIRALNMSPETLIGHVNSDETEKHIIEKVNSGEAESFAEAWQPFFNTFEFDKVYEGSDEDVTFEFNRSDESITAPAYKIKEMIFNDDKFSISANGTVFSREKKGVIPALLERWYSERKKMQKEAEKWENLMVNETDPKKKAEATKNFKYWDQRQMAKKINLNALYGALLNAHCRFYDKRIGQSTTLTGRSITRHMSSHINQQICGEYNHLGDSIVYGDTDSSYFSVYEAYMASGDEEKKAMANAMFEDRDLAVEIYNAISEKTNSSFPEFMDKRFNTGIDNGSIIKAGRENLASYSLFIKKKRYAMNLFDKDGIRLDKNGKNGKLKIMGLQIKRSDTPKMIQDCLKEGMDMLLNGVPEDKVVNYFTEFKDDLSNKEPWVLGRPSGANAVTHYTDLHYKYQNGQIDKKPAIPGAISGAIAWNEQLDIHNEMHVERIGNQSKVVTCKLRNNDFGYKNISYLTDQTKFPEWFKEMPFDTETMLETIYYRPILTIFGVLGWDVNLIRKGTKFTETFIMDDDEDEFF